MRFVSPAKTQSIGPMARTGDFPAAVVQVRPLQHWAAPSLRKLAPILEGDSLKVMVTTRI